MQTEILNSSGTAVAAVAISPAPDQVTDLETEQRLAAEIKQLWAVQVEAQTSAKKTQEELRKLRQELGERLYRLKGILARPGRAGQWSGFLTTSGISRTTADRLVTAHEQLVNPNAKCTDGAIQELTDEQIEQAVKALWGRLQKKLVTRRAVYQFLCQLIIQSGIAHECEQSGVLVLDPALLPMPEPECAAPAQGTATAVAAGTAEPLEGDVL
jgi:hypothetical protein